MKNKKIMNEYSIYWQPQNQTLFYSICPFVNFTEGAYYPPSTEFPNGYFHVYQNLNSNQFTQVDDAANNHVCIDIKPATRPPQSPTQR